MADATAVREPGWLTERRTRAADLARSLDLPSFKGTPGWEFTALDRYAPESFTPAMPGEGDASAVDRVQTLLEAPEGAIILDDQDGALRVIRHPAPALVARHRRPRLSRPLSQ